MTLFPKKVDLIETKADTINFKLDSLLVVGIGISPARVFFDELGSALAKQLQKKKVFVKYIFLGNNPKEAKRQYDTIDKSGFKAVLFSIPLDTAFFETRRNTKIYLSKMFPYKTTSTSTSYQQAFEFKLYAANEMNELFWNASIDISSSSSRGITSTKLAEKLIAQFKINQYIE